MPSAEGLLPSQGLLRVSPASYPPALCSRRNGILCWHLACDELVCLRAARAGDQRCGVLPELLVVSELLVSEQGAQSQAEPRPQRRPKEAGGALGL